MFCNADDSKMEFNISGISFYTSTRNGLQRMACKLCYQLCFHGITACISTRLPRTILKVPRGRWHMNRRHLSFASCRSSSKQAHPARRPCTTSQEPQESSKMAGKLDKHLAPEVAVCSPGHRLFHHLLFHLVFPFSRSFFQSRYRGLPTVRAIVQGRALLKPFEPIVSIKTLVHQSFLQEWRKSESRERVSRRM